MGKLKSALKSKTVWSLVALFVLNGLPGVADQLPQWLMPWINTLLTVLGVYSRVTPKQQF